MRLQDRIETWTRWSPRRRSRRLLAILVAMEILVGTATLGHRWLTGSAPVSTAQAVEQFRREASATPPATASSPGAASIAATPSAAASGPVSGSTSRGPTSSRSATPPAGMLLQAPAPGVYSWDTTGWEQADGVLSRNYPAESQRVVTSSGRTWTNHHIYSSNHEEWFDLTVSEHGVSGTYFRGKIAFGPFTEDQTVTFNPPMLFSAYPFRVGQTWQGSWSGSTSGTYSGKTFEHATIVIGGESVEVWGTELVMHMQGTISGDFTVQLWISPKYRFTMKEHYVENENSGGHNYKTDATITLKSTHPQT